MDTRDILYLFYRPMEPLYYPKKVEDDLAIFDIPADFLTEDTKDKAVTILNRFGSAECRRIVLGTYVTEEVYKLDLKNVLTVDRKKHFSQFIPQHQRAASHLIELFMNQKEFEKFIVYAAYCHDRVNAELYVYALSIAMLHREDTQNLALPAHWQTFPGKFMNASIIFDAQTVTQLYENPSDREPIEIPNNLTGTDAEPEHRMAYWREDIGINLYHWHWHLVYPPVAPKPLVNKDRRGELFFYMHRQILARYNVERLCNRLNLVERFLYWDKPMSAYFPKLYTTTSRENWPGRPAGLVLQDVHRSEIDVHIDMADITRWRTRIYEAIHMGYAIDFKGNKVVLDAENGADVLGSMVESNLLSVNSGYYGSLHGSGHFVISNVHDPTGVYLEQSGVMSDTTTAMRDPIFYELHSFIDDICYEHKDLLRPYTDNELNFPGIEIVKIDICNIIDDDDDSCDEEKSKLKTYWQKIDLDLSYGLDFSRGGPVYVRSTHLNHDDFKYTIEVNHKSESEKYGRVRIFIAPTHSSNGFELKLVDQRKLMIEMDKFTVKLQRGKNTILRKSIESSTTIPFEQTFRNLVKNRPPANKIEDLDRFNFCGCGWPQHMLLPIGTATGYSMQLFIMISDHEQDKVVDQEKSDPMACKIGVSLCGVKNRKYPDKRAMGYPFDRKPVHGVDTLSDFLKPNMKVINFHIIHSNTVKRSRLSNNKKTFQ